MNLLNAETPHLSLLPPHYLQVHEPLFSYKPKVYTLPMTLFTMKHSFKLIHEPP